MMVVNTSSIRPSFLGFFRWHLGGSWTLGPSDFPWKQTDHLFLFGSWNWPTFRFFPRTSCSNQLIRCEISMILDSFPSSFCIITWGNKHNHSQWETGRKPQIYHGSPQKSALTKGDSLYTTFQDHHVQPLRGISFTFRPVFTEEFLLGRFSERVSIELLVTEVCERVGILTCRGMLKDSSNTKSKFFVTLLGWFSDPFQWLRDLQLGYERSHFNHLVYLTNLSWPFNGHSTKMWRMFFLFVGFWWNLAYVSGVCGQNHWFKHQTWAHKPWCSPRS